MTGQILIVDGTATNRITLKVRLAAACYDALTARTAAEAMAILQRGGPSLVLVGGAVADSDPITLCAQITAMRPGLPIVVTVPEPLRLAALRAGAAAVMDAPLDEMNLFARIRGLMRDQDADLAAPAHGMAEAQAEFDLGLSDPGLSDRGLSDLGLADDGMRYGSPSSIVVIADGPAAGMAWRHALTGRVDAHLRISDPERALAEAALGTVPDLYLIAADIAQPGDGLRLLSELRSRRHSRDSAFAIMLSGDRQDMMSVALDLGAGDVLPLQLSSAALADEAGLRLLSLIRRKRGADARRAAAESERRLARLDPLTGLPNRRYALPRLHALCRQGPAGGGRCAAIAIDIDRFKMVNDGYGHATGDAVLVAVAERLQAAMPASGFIARMGGEEFLAVLPDADGATAARIAERMRDAVSAAPIPLDGRDAGLALRITISAGVALLDDSTEGTAAAVARMMENADDALLRAKRSGRDRMIVSGLEAAA